MTDQTVVAPDPPRIYLTPEEILAEKIYLCSFDNCFALLYNLANLQMHLTRHHKAPAANLQFLCNASKSERRLFYCPIISCPYYQSATDSTNGARSFSSLRSLKQHYLKVHGERKHACEACGKSFATESYLRHHRLSCGRKFICEYCTYTYGSREALLTHAKRKQHGYEALLLAKKSNHAKAAKGKPARKCVTTSTQTFPERSGENRATQTNEVVEMDAVQSAVEKSSTVPVLQLPVKSVTVEKSCNTNSIIGSHVIESVEPLAPVVCTETQTDFIDFMFSSTENRHDPLLSYAHMYTQTYDEPGLLTDLGLSTTETQTSWNEAGETFGDYLVSTETQTNFDIDSFDCSSNNCTGDKTSPGNCKQTQIPEPMQNEFHMLRGAADFLSDLSDSIDDHASVHVQDS
uniref:C2H2-type domain-containing protein n=1 Tax=Anopheles christyi TaxID=43041 RepID=A0A182K0U7_9DIPT